jgi:capsular polysaccharide export protein
VGGIRDAALETPAFTINLWPVKPVLFSNSFQRARSASSKTGRHLMVWASSQTKISNSTVRLEDGFLRSNGFGAKLTPPMSLVTDKTSIYYDARQPSQLEHMIATSDTLRPDQRHRAARLQQCLITLGLSKYNVGQAAAEPGLARPNTTGKTTSTLVDQRRILVPGASRR